MRFISLPFPLDSTAYFDVAEEGALSLLRIINCYPNVNWTVEYSYGLRNHREIMISVGVKLDPESIVQFLTPWIPSIDRLTIEVDHEVLTASIAELTPQERSVSRLAFDEVNLDHGSKRTTVRIELTSSDPMPVALTDGPSVDEYVSNFTWMGSQKYIGKNRELGLVVGPTKYKAHGLPRVAGASRRVEVRAKSSLYTSNSISYTFTRSEGDLGHEFRLSEMGRFDVRDVTVLLDRSGPRKPPEGIYEIESPLVKVPVGGIPKLAHLNAAVVEEFINFIKSINDAPNYLKYCESIAAEKLAKSAKLLDERKSHLITADYVFFNGQQVYKVPKNENELISLHQKLEGLKAVPLAQFLSLEFTPQLGIDAIARFKIREGDSVHSFGGVEFEFKFDSFFKHGHPEGQTDLIVCWTIEGPRESSLTPDRDFGWLYYLDFDTKKIPVVCVNKYPKLTIRKVV